MQSTFTELALSEPTTPPVHICAVCSAPSMLSCAYCINGPAYCSSEHCRQVSMHHCLHLLVLPMNTEVQHWGAHASICDGSRSPESVRSSGSISLSTMLAGTPRNSTSIRRPTVVAVHESRVMGYVLGSNARTSHYSLTAESLLIAWVLRSCTPVYSHNVPHRSPQRSTSCNGARRLALLRAGLRLPRTTLRPVQVSAAAAATLLLLRGLLQGTGELQSRSRSTLCAAQRRPAHSMD